MKLIHIFQDVHMACGHDALAHMLKEQTGASSLKSGECAVFINTTWTALKMMVPGDVLLHLRRPQHKPINRETIRHLPNCVRGGDLNYSEALKRVIVAKVGKVKSEGPSY